MLRKHADIVRRCSGSRGEVHPGTAAEIECWVCGATVLVVPYNHPRYGASYMLEDHNRVLTVEVSEC